MGYTCAAVQTNQQHRTKSNAEIPSGSDIFAGRLQGLAKDKASGRKAAIATAVKKLGGKLDAMYFCLGDDDVILIADLPDHISAAALSSAACASGMARTSTRINC